jgi:hypothetical protein
MSRLAAAATKLCERQCAGQGQSIADAVKELRKTNLSAVVPLIRHMMLSADADAVVASSLSLPADITIVAVPVGHHFFKIDALTLGLFDADQANQVCKLELKENETAILFGRRFINLNGHLLACLRTMKCSGLDNV